MRSLQASIAMFTRQCISHGVPFQLRAGDPHTLASMLDAVPFGTEYVALESANTACFTLPPNAHLRFPFLLARLEHQILLHVAVHAPDRTFVHAGVVAWQGRAIVFPGHSCAGKTTLVAELIKLGAVYYSDEYALLDLSGRVHPFARDLHMREPGSLHQIKVPAADLHGQTALSPALVTHVVITEYAAGSEWNPQPLTPGLAVLELLRFCVPVRRSPARVLTTLRALMHTARACSSSRGDARATAELLVQAFASEPLPA